MPLARYLKAHLLAIYLAIDKAAKLDLQFSPLGEFQQGDPIIKIQNKLL
ncbi:hypothetical protein NEOC65_001065 [Neochlamydia sp. AcF65]|nr:hypothetical protein [Neochlamydia sp. AcF65]